MTAKATGPGAACWCGCDTVLPPQKRRDARYVDSSHRARASEARKAAKSGSARVTPAEALRSARRPARRDLVTLTLAPLDAHAAHGALRLVLAAYPDELARSLEPLADSLQQGIERRRQRKTKESTTHVPSPRVT